MIAVRLATPADKNEILGRLSEGVYSGFDYLAFVFDFWLEEVAEGSRHLFVAIDRETEKIVAFDSLYVLDQGKTAISQALRVLPEYQGKGIAQQLSREIDRVRKEKHPHVQRLRASTGAINEASKAIHRKLGYVETVQYRLFMMTSVPKDVTALQAAFPERLDRVQQICATDLWRRFGPQLEQLLPEKCFNVDWVPFEVSLANLVHHESKECMSFSVVLAPGADGELLESVGFHTAKHFRYANHIVHRHGADVAYAVPHLLYAIGHAQRISAETGNVYPVFETFLDSQADLDRLARFFPHDFASHFPFSTCVLMEKQLSA
eukprot:m.153632 g.153632  ORF g.153632 m.153632 type:complete len:320 (+) comp20765_c0_seq3:1900-2859(+)